MRLAFLVNGIALLLAATTVGCTTVGYATPAPTVRLESALREVTWISGRGAAQKEAAGVRVAAAFEQQDGEHLGIRVEIQNLREEKLEIEPQRFTVTACHGETLESCQPSQRVVDPEAMLSAIDRQSARERNDAVRDSLSNSMWVLLGAVADAGDPRGHAAVAIRTSEVDDLRHEKAQASLAAQRQMLSNEALRRHTLNPGMSVAGNVFIPIDLDASVVWLHVRGDGWKIAFPFYQYVTRTN